MDHEYFRKKYCTYSVSGDIWNIFIHSTLKLNLLCYGKQRSKGQLNHMIHTFHRNFTCILSYSRFPTSVLNIFDWRPTVDKPRGQVNLLFEDVLSCLLARCSFLAPALKEKSILEGRTLTMMEIILYLIKSSLLQLSSFQ